MRKNAGSIRKEMRSFQTSVSDNRAIGPIFSDVAWGDLIVTQSTFFAPYIR